MLRGFTREDRVPEAVPSIELPGNGTFIVPLCAERVKFDEKIRSLQDGYVDRDPLSPRDDTAGMRITMITVTAGNEELANRLD